MKPTTMVPPPSGSRVRNQTPVYSEEPEEVEQPSVKKNVPKKSPPPPGFKPQPQTVSQTYQQGGQ